MGRQMAGREMCHVNEGSSELIIKFIVSMVINIYKNRE